MDVSPRVERANLDRLSSALTELDARIRTTAVPEGLVFDHGGASLGRSIMWNLVCPAGEFDLAFAPAGGLGTRVAAVADVIRSKRLAGRDKDVRALPEIVEQARTLGLID